MNADELVSAVESAVPGAVGAVEFGLATITVPSAQWEPAVRHVRDTPGLDCTYFDMLCGVDEAELGIGVVVHLYSPAHGHRLLLRTVVAGAQPALASLTTLFAGADWHERETFEMFGVAFDGHPRPGPLLLPDDVSGHPLRKDFALTARTERAWPGDVDPGKPA